MTAPVYDRFGVQVFHGDCLDVMRGLESESISAIITDPPAGISFMSKTWDSDRGGRDRWVEWLTERIREAMRLLKPGAHALVWALPRTSHWTAWALEDAGFEIRDCIVHLFGQGFAKSLDVSKAIDIRGGSDGAWFAEWLRTVRTANQIARSDLSAHFLSKRGGLTGKIWNWEHGLGIPTQSEFNRLCDLLGVPRTDVFEAEREVLQHRSGIHAGYGPGDTREPNKRPPLTAPATPHAEKWDGWGTNLKPAQEMWWLCRKPFKGNVAANVLTHGTGALNIDASRVAAGQDYLDKCASIVGLDSNRNGAAYGEWAGARTDSAHVSGRRPANVVLSHCPLLDPATDEVLGDACADGCVEGCPVAELDHQSKGTRAEKPSASGTVMGSGMWGIGSKRNGSTYADSGGASRFFHCFRWEAKAPSATRPKVNGKQHPTVKPVPLLRWAAKLITPPGGVVLDCFAGTGTTGQAARAEGFPCILIEQDPDAIDMIRARLDALPKTDAPADGQPVETKPAQGDLFDLLGGVS